MDKVFITGICGFVASNVANKMHSLGYEVFGVDNLKFGYEKNLLPDIKWSKMDFNDVPVGILNQYDILLHMACDNIIYAQTNQINTFKTNGLESIELIKKFHGKVVYISTSSIYGNAKIIPTTEDCEYNIYNAYDTSKLITECFLKHRGNYTTLRLTNTYGKNQRPENPFAGVIARFVDCALKDEPIPINGNGESTRDYTYVEDTVNAIIYACEYIAMNTEINIGTGIETNTLKLAVIINNMLKKSPNLEYINNRSIDNITRRCLNITKAKKLLGWEPKVSLEEGILKTINWQINE